MNPVKRTTEEASDIPVAVTVWGDVNTVATTIQQRLDLPEILGFIAAFSELK